MVHKIVEQERKKVEKMSTELKELQEQEALERKQRELEKTIGRQKFWIRHHTLKEGMEGVKKGVSGMKAGTKGYLMFVRKDVAPAMIKGMHIVMKEWKKKGKPLTDKEIKEYLEKE
jgi:phosphatidate phosphatase PAH1